MTGAPAAAERARDEVLEILGQVMDPEVPVLSIVELGIVRDVRVGEGDGRVTIVLTPTYSGCPAMRTIEEDLRAALGAHGVRDVHVETVFAPAWTTEWLSAASRQKLDAYGIAPPPALEPQRMEAALVPLRRRGTPVRCPHCGSGHTIERSAFGATACKALWSCRTCGEPFELFKAV